MKRAEGENSNPLMQDYMITEPVIKDKSKIPAISLPSTYLYDIATIAGKSYTFIAL